MILGYRLTLIFCLGLVTACDFESARGTGKVTLGQDRFASLGLPDFDEAAVTVTVETIQSHFKRRMIREHVPNEMHWRWQEEAVRVGLEPRSAAGHAVLDLAGRNRSTRGVSLHTAALEDLRCQAAGESGRRYQCQARLVALSFERPGPLEVRFLVDPEGAEPLASVERWQILSFEIRPLGGDAPIIEIRMLTAD